MSYEMPVYSSLAQVPGTSAYHTARSYIKGQGFIHVPGQVGTYSEWMEGGAERKALFYQQQAVAREHYYPYKTGGMDWSQSLEAKLYGTFQSPAQMVAATGAATGANTAILQAPTTMVMKTNASRTAGTTASRVAGTGIAGGGTALARGGPALGITPGAGLNLSGVGTSISSAGAGVMSTVTQYLPLAIKIGAVLIGIKLLMWLVRGKSR